MKILCAIILILFSVEVKSQTVLWGAVYSDTTLTKSNSPYTVSGNFIVFDNVTVTIEPGVKIRFNAGAAIELRGKLKAIGTATDTIYFTSQNANETWGGINAKFYSASNNIKIRMDYCYFAYADALFTVGTERDSFNNCTFYRNNIVNVGDPYKGLYFNSCFFEENNEAVNGGGDASNVYINNCSFVGNAKGAIGGHVNNCLFTNNSDYGAYMYQSITNSHFYNNNIGILADHHNGTRIEFNEIHNNIVGVEIQRMWQDPNIVFRHNKVCNNKSWNVLYDYVYNINISNNCWCSNDSSIIRSKIFDGYINPSDGILDFMPYDICSLPVVPNCDTPGNVTVSNKTQTSLIVNWDTVPGTLGYEYMVYKTGGKMPLYGTVDLQHSVLIQSLSPGTKYSLCVRAKCSPISYSPWVCVIDSTLPPLAIGSISSQDYRVKVYPNPISNLLNIDIPITDNNTSKLIITNVIGYKVYDQMVNAGINTINTETWTKGIYLLNYQNESHIYTIRIVK